MPEPIKALIVDWGGVLTDGADGDGPTVASLVRRARVAGLATAVLSNCAANAYPRAEWVELFDVIVVSGEVGLQKPDPAIYELTAKRLGLAPAACVFVDDLAANARSAAEIGMVSIQHRSYAETALELAAILGFSLE